MNGQPVDAKTEAFLSKLEKEREAFGVLFPSPAEMIERIKLITTTSGVPPDLYDLCLALAEWEILTAMEEKRKIDWNLINPILFLTQYAPSLKGRHADRAVEISRAAPFLPQEMTLFNRLVGKE